MSMNHLPQQDLALYVLGVLEPVETARLEQHVAACQSCAAALAAEAQLEVKLQAVVPAALRQLPAPSIAAWPIPLLAEPPVPRRRWPMVSVLAASLAVLIGLALSRGTSPLPPPLDSGGALLATMSVVSASESYSEWLPEAGPPQCGLPGRGLLCQPQLPEPPAVLREAAFSAAASWLPVESGQGFTPITSACYAPR